MPTLWTKGISHSTTCFRRRSNMRMKQFRFMSSSSQSKSIVLPPGCPKFLKGLRNGLRMGLRNGLWKGLWNGLNTLCCPRRPGSEVTLTWKKAQQQMQMTSERLRRFSMVSGAPKEGVSCCHTGFPTSFVPPDMMYPHKMCYEAGKRPHFHTSCLEMSWNPKNDSVCYHFHPTKCG